MLEKLTEEFYAALGTQKIDELLKPEEPKFPKDPSYGKYGSITDENA
jgi:hypothetical protein